MQIVLDKECFLCYSKYVNKIHSQIKEEEVPMAGSTKQFKKRNAILDCLRRTTVHPSAEMLHEMLKPDHPDISLATVYRNLSRFRNEGTIVSVATVKGVERFDANTEPHVHFVCTGCGSVLDLPQIAVPQALCAEVTSQTGGIVDLCQLTFTGICSDCCQNQNKNKN